MELKKSVIGFTTGDVNGLGIEMTVKSVANTLIFNQCVPILYATNKVVNFYRKALPDANFTSHIIKSGESINPKQVNIFPAWEEDIALTPGTSTEQSIACGEASFAIANKDLKEGRIDAMINLPLPRTNPTPERTPNNNVVMYISDTAKIACISPEIWQSAGSNHISVLERNIFSRVQQLNKVLRRDFGIWAPKIALLLPKSIEDLDVKNILHHVKQYAIHQHIYCVSIHDTDLYFKEEMYRYYDAAICFNSAEIQTNMIATANDGIFKMLLDKPMLRFDILPEMCPITLESKMENYGPVSFTLFTALSIIKNRKQYADDYRNPLKRMSTKVLANAVDENISE